MSSAQPLVSLCLATYQHEEFILDCVQGLLNQDHQNVEVVVVDDGSTDKTFEILSQIKDSRLIALTQKNQGPSVAISNAIRKSRGDYIATFSGDDMAKPQKVSASLKYLLSSQSDLIFTLPEIIDENGKKYPDEDFPIFFGKKFSNSYEFLRHLYYGGNFICASTSLAKAEVYKNIPLFNPASLQLQDFEMWIRLAKKHKISLLEERWSQYRVLSSKKNLSSHSNDVRMYFELMMIYEKFFDGISDETLIKSFGSELSLPNSFSETEKQIAISFFYLKHHLKEVRIIGLKRLFNLIQEPEAAKLLSTKFHFENKDFFKMANEIDFMNLRISSDLERINLEFISKGVRADKV